MAGKAIMEALVAAVRRTPSITVLEGEVAEGLVTQDGRVTGVVSARRRRARAAGFPVVPEGTARIRVQMSAALEREHLETRDRGIQESSDPNRGRGFRALGTNMRRMAANIVGLGLLVAGVIFMIIGGVVGWIIGVICVIGGVGALFMTWQRNRRAAAQ